MPRGFLVKRTQKHHATGARLRVAEEEDRNETGYGSELDSPLLIHTSSYPYPYGSPDSGFSQSPVNLSTKSTRQSDVDGQKYEDGQSDCQSTSGKETLASDVSSGSDLDDAHVQVKGEERSSPKTTNGSESRFGDPRAACYGLPQHVAPSALSIATSAIGSPQFYFSAFDRLSVTSPKGYGFPRNAPPYLRAAGLYTGFPSMAAPGRMAPNSPASPAGGVSPNKRKSPENHSSGATPKAKSAKKPKAARKINFDEDKSSPVSGTIIRDPSDVDDENGIRVVSGDIDASLNFVEVTPEAREELAKIENRIGAYICQLCKEHYEDAFQLAQHRCSRIIHVEYRCPECDKVFNCPANLASHRRWHKPRPNGTASNNNNNNNNNNSNNNHNNNNNNNNSSSQNHNDNGGKDKNNSDMKRTLNAINGNISGRSLHPAVFLDGMTKLMGRGVENLLQAASGEGQIADSESLFECEKCGKKFRRQAYLRKHLSTHVTAGSEPAMTSSCCCPICGKAFGSEPSRAEHALLFHGAQSFEPKSSRTRADEFGCALCGRGLANQLELEHHQRLQHPNEVYACKYCTAVFYSSPGLTRHTNKCHPAENRRVILLQMQPPSMSQINSPC